MQVKISDLSLKSVPFLQPGSARIEGPLQLAASEPLSTANLWENAQTIYRSLPREDQQDVDSLMKRLEIALAAVKQAEGAGVDTVDFCMFAVDAYGWIVAWAENLEREQIPA